MHRISPFLWFDNQAEEAANFYVSIFPNSKMTSVARYGDAGPGPKGTVMTVAFELDGQPVVALNGGPIFKFTPALSLVVNCETQDEIDHYWQKLPAGGGEPGQCGWLKDKFDLSWQVVPTIVGRVVMADKDPTKANRVMAAVMKMTKLDVAAIKRAFEGG